MRATLALVHAWLVLDFFGDARKRGGGGSTLTTTIFTQAFLALVLAALLYPETPPVPFAAANLSLSALFAAIGELGDQEKLDRRRADAALVGTSPLRSWFHVLARAGHAGFYLCLVTIGMALPPAILLGYATSAWTAVGYVVMACVTSGIASAVLAVIVRALSRLFGSARAALFAGTLKAVVLGMGIALFALGLQGLRGTVDTLPIGRAGAELLPSYQAARWLANPVSEAWRLGTLAGAGLILALLALALGMSHDERASRPHGKGPLAKLLSAVAGRGPGRGVAEYVAICMWRSPGFRARVLPLLGLPAGMVYLVLRGGEHEQGFPFLCVLLQLPAIYLPFLIAFLPRSDQENTRWLFDQAPRLWPALVQDATWRALVTHVLVPVHAIGAVLFTVLYADRAEAAAACAFAFGVAVLAARWLVRSIGTVPFTEDRGNEMELDLGRLLQVAAVLLAAAVGYGLLPGPGWRWLPAVAVFGGAVLMLRQPLPGGTAAGRLAESAEEAQPSAPRADETGQLKQGATLGRELRAIAVLYLALAVLPLGLGAMLGH